MTGERAAADTGAGRTAVQEQAPDSTLLLGVDTLMWAHAALFVADVLGCTEHPLARQHAEASGRSADEPAGVYMLWTHPIRTVRICGVVAMLQRQKTATVASVDDGTGVVPCVIWERSADGVLVKGSGAAGEPCKSADLRLGDLVTVMGRVSDFRGERQILVGSMRIESDGNVEAAEWLAALDLRTRVYRRPLAVPRAVADAAAAAHGAAAAADDAGGGASSLADAVLAHMDAQGERAVVSFRRACADPQLRAAAAAAAAAARAASAAAVDGAIAGAFRALAAAGAVFQRDAAADTYERVTHGGVLGPLLLAVFRAEARAGAAAGRGDAVPLDLAVLRLREYPELQRVPRARIVESVGLLVAAGDLFEANEGRFGVVS